ncbi:extracellular catalytic domain type 1 short-chain-length polyhydroxyalkanoate depolymerase [Nocardiopsis ansamitocini]|uniref:Esterase n=1 Tax=Nocardiopsis ansamitocini TaxID=1670832 RepID=A0A9W6PB25_9ACTN|nr:PHB depolymerase family esterase [Nocardiopsis ansamitocini]GLU50278.1 hypothetical protein Nans01_46290 [Nocardiopsis ansamitocini]
MAVGAVGAVAGAALLLAAGFQFGLPWSFGERDHIGVFSSDQGNQFYEVHLPPQYSEGGPGLPVMMAIHGCAMTGFGWNSMEQTTQFNALADEEGFIVVYPTQSVFKDKLNCWKSGDSREQHRDRGEPSLLAGVAREVVERYGADPDRVHVSGASSGAGTAVILAATYPDVFATATSVAGGEYALDQVNVDDPDQTPPSYTARQAWAQMGDRARQVPLLVVQGDADEVVPPVVATRLVQQWLAVNDLVDDGLLNDSVGATPDEVVHHTPDGLRNYTHSTYTAEGSDTSLVESYVVEGMGHSWSGPHSTGLFTDREGPDLARIVWDFATAHPMG